MIAYLITLATCLAGFVKRNSRTVSIIMLVALWVLMGLNSYNADYINYQYIYNGSTIYVGAGQTVGYWFLVGIAKQFGLDFAAFRAVCCAIGLLNVYFFVSRYTKATAFVLAVYMICPFFYDIVQFRFFFASSFAVAGMRFLVEGEGKKKLLFAVFVAVASLIHPACALFLAFYITCLPERRALACSIALALMFLVATYTGIAASLASLVMDEVKAQAYLTTMGRFGFLPYWVSIILSALFVAGTRRSGTGGPDSDGFLPVANREEQAELRALMFNDFARKAVFVLLPLGALLPLSVQNFYRVIRSSLVIFYIYYANASFGAEAKHIGNTERRLLFIFFWVWLALTAYVLFSGVWDLVVVTELENNLLWS